MRGSWRRSAVTRWRVEYLDPNPGLVDFVTSANLIVAWTQRTGLARDEQRHETLVGCSEQRWDGPDSPLTEAVNEVLEATGEDLDARQHGIICSPPEVLERVAQRAGIDPATHVYGYRVQNETNRLPFECALTLGRAIANRRPCSASRRQGTPVRDRATRRAA